MDVTTMYSEYTAVLSKKIFPSLQPDLDTSLLRVLSGTDFAETVPCTETYAYQFNG